MPGEDEMRECGHRCIGHIVVETEIKVCVEPFEVRIENECVALNAEFAAVELNPQMSEIQRERFTDVSSPRRIGSLIPGPCERQRIYKGAPLTQPVMHKVSERINTIRGNIPIVMQVATRGKRWMRIESFPPTRHKIMVKRSKNVGEPLVTYLSLVVTEIDQLHPTNDLLRAREEFVVGDRNSPSLFEFPPLLVMDEWIHSRFPNVWILGKVAVCRKAGVRIKAKSPTDLLVVAKEVFGYACLPSLNLLSVVRGIEVLGFTQHTVLSTHQWLTILS